MQKEKGIVSIKVKLLGVIVPVVIVSILVLVLIAYRTSAGLIESYSENLLESSVENQASQIESWLEQNIGAFQIVKTTIENTKPDDKEYRPCWIPTIIITQIIRRDFTSRMRPESSGKRRIRR